MTDYIWPSDLVPAGSSFKLQPHTGGSQSPFTRQSKIYGLSAPLWTCTLSFNALRGSRWGIRQTGARLDAIVAKLRGRENRIALWDFDVPSPRGGLALATGSVAAARGDSSMTITGMPPGSPIYAGGYIGGDGRPHIISSDDLADVVATADGTGQATLFFDPPLQADIAADAASFAAVKAWFRLADDNLGDNFNQVDQAAVYSLQFLEDLGPSVDVTFSGTIVTFSH